ncbi:MAG: hypothetical protein P8P74_07160 [Crocinitomicaceae bacterium]|nr:hypothetical protein [Crocinitomicaceae bacterium]
MIEPAIVVIAYNRVQPLKRLLKSLANVNYPSNTVTLHISIDASDNLAVKETADNFEWKHGEKVVDVKAENLGLLKHVLECGKLTEKYGSIIVLEDDLLVASGFYQYAQQANEFYSTDEKIAGVSLFAYPVEENNFYPFVPIQDDSDVHFIQVASSWGQSWNKDQWTKFKSWLTENPGGKDDQLPDYILEWGNNSWKKLFISYLMDTDRYFVFPNTSYSTNFEEEGTHASKLGLFQVPIQAGLSQPRLKKWNESNSIYDVYFELKSECLKRTNPYFKEYDFEVDLYGNRRLDFSAEYILTSRRGTNPLKAYGSEMKPLLQNIVHNAEGNDLILCRKEDLSPTEKNRFLMLNTSPVVLDQHSSTRGTKLEQVTLVIPTLDDQLQALESTISGLKSDRFYNVTFAIVCSAEIKKSVLQIALSSTLNINLIESASKELDGLLRAGIENCSTDYCTWIQPGMTIDLERMEDVARIFQGLAHVQVIHGLQENVSENSYFKLNTSSLRWTPQRANANKEEAAKIRTELVVWRSSLISNNDKSILTSANLFLELIKLNPIYPVALKLGDFNGVEASNQLSSKELREILSGDQFQQKRGFTSALRPIFKFWFKRNVPFFRLFYKDTEELPLVIRYDFKNNSYYFLDY